MFHSYEVLRSVHRFGYSEKTVLLDSNQLVLFKQTGRKLVFN